jgi:hypothetical protein
MLFLKEWKKHWVVQKNDKAGFILSGFEWLLRYKNFSEINYQGFQKQFDLEKAGTGQNNFKSIVRAIQDVYPKVNIKVKQYSSIQGTDKIFDIENLIVNNKPCIMSITLSKNGGWHIVPIIAFDDDYFFVIWKSYNKKQINLTLLSKTKLIYLNNNWPGGNDIAYIDD